MRLRAASAAQTAAANRRRIATPFPLRGWARHSLTARPCPSQELGVLHTTSPMVWFEDGQYLGGADDAVTWAKVNFTSPKSVIRRVGGARTGRGGRVPA